MESVFQQKSNRSCRSRSTVHSLRSPREFSLAATLPFFIVSLGATTAAYDTGESADLPGLIQEPSAMMLAGLALLGLAFVARQWSGKNRPGSASQ
jgi:hypothetical protein